MSSVGLAPALFSPNQSLIKNDRLVAVEALTTDLISQGNLE